MNRFLNKVYFPLPPQNQGKASAPVAVQLDKATPVHCIQPVLVGRQTLMPVVSYPETQGVFWHLEP